MDPAEVVAVLAALLGGYLAGRSAGAHSGENGGSDPLRLVTGTVQRAGHVAGATAGQVVTRSVDAGRRVVSGAGDLTALGVDAVRGAAAGAGFGFIQFRAARHVRGRAPSSRAAVAPEPATDNAAAEDDPEPSSAPGDATVVLVTNGTRFHRPGCASVRGDSREVSRDEALAEGRVPCRACNP